MQTRRRAARSLAIDLFSGAGGLTRGLRDAGFSVIGAIENDSLAADSYRLNFARVHLWESDIRNVTGTEIRTTLRLRPGQLDLLAGCPPCEGFSTLRTRNGHAPIIDPRNDLIIDFGRLVSDLLPKYVMLENVPALTEDRRFHDYVSLLRKTGYSVRHAVKDVSLYGVPQKRRRLILVAARGRCRPLPAEPVTTKRLTVRRALGGMLPAGVSGDELHDHGERRSDEVRTLIAAVPKDGGSRADLPDSMQLACHARIDGFHDVYGRMAWDRPAPTITGGCINPSKGRFLHPEEDRAITLREAALLQSFPPRHRFSLRRGKYAAAELIGNALPPAFVRRHARPIAEALDKHRRSRVHP
ncbi:MAG: DNA cytosine methyltransferase [Actinomycetota bacterium]|nr:DNA cytosine methyltransferase [Actinomycetota bacterium]